MQKLAELGGRQMGSAFAMGDPLFVAGAMATSSLLSYFAQKGQTFEANRLTEELAEQIERIRVSGTFVPISEIAGIETPAPACWRAEVVKRLRTERGVEEKAIRLIHSGDAFATFRLDDQTERTVFWDKVESYSFTNTV
ncbi:MAG: hypothetical protein JSS02_21850 [Planctomycetes bacterium]|nr:hypothetical protein [Planctomycetota bacterium]